MSRILDYLDNEIFSPVYQNGLPMIKSRSVQSVCDELFYTIKANEPIFIYGDYDADGFCSNLVWEETLSVLYDVPPIHFMYGERQHTVDRDILRQVNMSGARVVIICDSGSSLADRRILEALITTGHTPIVIDHHVYDGDYIDDCGYLKMYNAYEERGLLNQHEVCGAYACLLIAHRLCKEYFGRPLPFNAAAYALCAMYADVVDMSTPEARALYNFVATSNLPGPGLFVTLNKWNYMYTRRLFSFIIVPKINACFRTERYEPLNKALQTRDRYSLAACGALFEDTHSLSRELVKLFVPQFERVRFGNIILATHEVTQDTKMLHIRNFSGIIANRIAEEEHCLAVVLIKDGGVYGGSYRDYFNRRLLDTFQVFCDANGHDQAFGLSVTDYNDFKRHLSILSTQLVDRPQTDDLILSSSLLETAEDVSVVALYNEYMNTRPFALVAHRCDYARLVRSTTYKKFYDVGLPLNIQTKTPVTTGSNISLEPCMTGCVELRCIE